MSEDNIPAETGPGQSGKANSWRRHLPHLQVLALALAGVVEGDCNIAERLQTS
jgi:hypothetical protein